ncbi:MAG: MBOAT family protein [Lachnospiraceae bacterium]|nr:MBOAT family protein [Lachnospiraceae bacterium]
MVYYKLVFAAAFLPAVLLLYRIIPKKYRYLVLLLASAAFYSTFSLGRMVYPVIAGLIAYAAALAMEKQAAKGKEGQKTKKRILILGIAALLALLLNVKYTDFFLENLTALSHLFGGEKSFGPVNPRLPLGISFYTMQAIGYLADVYWKKIPAQKNPLKLCLFLLFFPTIIQGPITPYTAVGETLFAGADIKAENLIRGYFRLGWGALKKLVVADRLYPAVAFLFADPGGKTGGEVVAAAVLFTLMEYMDFSGCIDMAIGCGQLFGITLPENFKQPFLAKNASEFWRRWHISLGVWFKTYIFYPVSISGTARKWMKYARGKKISPFATKMVISAMALFPVWLCNGLWHGPKWTYIFYGLFYFVVILTELLLEPAGKKLLEKMKLTDQSPVVGILRILRTWIVIFVGELFFEADSVRSGLVMFSKLFTAPGFGGFGERVRAWGLSGGDWIVAGLFLTLILGVNLLREKCGSVQDLLMKKKMPLRITLALLLGAAIMIFGLYGPGYTEVDMIYAGF